jgi:PleD family two-component response regulator
MAMEPSADKGKLSIDSVVSRVDALLYRAKNEGRNRVVAEQFSIPLK